MLTESLRDSEFALYDIDPQRLKESEMMLQNLNKNTGGYGKVVAYDDRRAALKGADYVVNAIQVGGYKPATVIDFEIPKRYGLRQTIADTLGIGGIFRALRTFPVLEEFARDMEELCPDAWFLNYSNPMAMLTGYMLRYTGVKTVGLCHSVQTCASELLSGLGIGLDGVAYHIAGINHMAWLLEITKDGEDLYPLVKELAAKREPNHHDLVCFQSR